MNAHPPPLWLLMLLPPLALDRLRYAVLSANGMLTLYDPISAISTPESTDSVLLGPPATADASEAKADDVDSADGVAKEAAREAASGGGIAALRVGPGAHPLKLQLHGAAVRSLWAAPCAVVPAASEDTCVLPDEHVAAAVSEATAAQMAAIGARHRPNRRRRLASPTTRTGAPP